MAYDEPLAVRVRGHLATQPGLIEKPMFGGLAFLVKGNLGICIQGLELMVRVSREDMTATLAHPDARAFDLSRRPMAGWVLIRAEGLTGEDALATWIRKGIGYAASLPPKPK